VSDDEYMTLAEFAALPSAVHHAVWRAWAEHRIDAVPVTPSTTSTTYRYDRAQVQAIARGLKASRRTGLVMVTADMVLPPAEAVLEALEAEYGQPEGGR
jgi:non-ribosomal peptide synthetase component F